MVSRGQAPFVIVSAAGPLIADPVSALAVVMTTSQQDDEQRTSSKCVSTAAATSVVEVEGVRLEWVAKRVTDLDLMCQTGGTYLSISRLRIKRRG